MKKFFYLMLLAIMPMCFTACSSDDDEPTGVAGIEALYGSWQYTGGYAYEEGAKHHERSVDASEAEYLRFDKSGKCLVSKSDYGMFYSGTYSFSFDEENKTLSVGYRTVTVDVLTGSSLRLKRSSSKYSGDYDYAIYTKVSDSVWDNLK